MQVPILIPLTHASLIKRDFLERINHQTQLCQHDKMSCKNIKNKSQINVSIKLHTNKTNRNVLQLINNFFK